MEITENRVGWVPGNLVLGGITDQTLLRSESNIGRRRSVSLIIHYYLYPFMLPHCHARVRCTQIDPNCRALFLVCHCRPEREVQRLYFDRRRSSKAFSKPEWSDWKKTDYMRHLIRCWKDGHLAGLQFLKAFVYEWIVIESRRREAISILMCS